MKTTEKSARMMTPEPAETKTTPQPEPENSLPSVEELRQLLDEASRQANELVLSKINTLEKDHNVGIGIRLDANRLSDILRFMLNNNKTSISLKCEVWQNPATNL